MSLKTIRTALTSKVATWAAAQVPQIPVQFENDTAFVKPANGARYARCFVMPVQTESGTLDQQHRNFEGVLQLTLCMPLGKGGAEAADLVDSLDAAFAPNAPIARGGLTVRITSPMSAGTGIPEDDCYAVPVSCNYRCDTYPS